MFCRSRSSLLTTCWFLQLRQNKPRHQKALARVSLQSRWIGLTGFVNNQEENICVSETWANSILKEANKNHQQRAQGEGYLKRPGVNEKDRIDLVRRICAESKARRKLRMAQPPYNPADSKLIWVDCEMSGLNPTTDTLLEIAIAITDKDLNVIAKHDSVVLKTDESVLAGMGEWCQIHHGESGLIDGCRKSTITLEAADEMLLKFVQTHTSPQECPIAGNSVGQDQGFIRNQLPKLYSHLHYRVIDVSTIKELTRRWYPEVFSAAPKKKFAHRVMDDIQDSINELKYYRSAVFIPDNVKQLSKNSKAKSET